jgi:hypothetical protein
MNIISHRVAAYPSPLGPVMLVHVLTKDDIGQLAAYAAIVPDSRNREFDLDWTAHHGTKLTQREAIQIFPGVSSGTYRR